MIRGRLVSLIAACVVSACGVVSAVGMDESVHCFDTSPPDRRPVHVAAAGHLRVVVHTSWLHIARAGDPPAILLATSLQVSVHLCVIDAMANLIVVLKVFNRRGYNYLRQLKYCRIPIQ